MTYKIFCDENITSGIINEIKSLGIEITSVREKGIYGIGNGELLEMVNAQAYTFLTFDKDFLANTSKSLHGIIVIDIKPNTDDKVIPIIKEFFTKLVDKNYSLLDKCIRLNLKFLNELV